MSYATITCEHRDAVALITLNRPDRLNAWTPQMASEQADAIRGANDDDDIGAIVMTGTGRGFCAGADMRDTFKTRLDGTDPGGQSEDSGGMPPDVDWVALARESKPLIAAVNGPAVGIGMTMILPFDVIVASERAKFGMLFIKIGLVPELASTRLLVQRLGLGRASEMCLTGRLYDGAEAHRIGLADRLTPAEELLDVALGPGVRDRGQSRPATAHDQVPADRERRRDRSAARATARARADPRVLAQPRAPPRGRGVPGQIALRPGPSPRRSAPVRCLRRQGA